MSLRIVAVALKRNGIIFSKPAPARHHELLNSLHPMYPEVFGPNEQGFLGSDGKFYGRISAKALARDAGQVGTTMSDELFSEDLW